MTNKITKEFLFTELSIKIATLEMKVDKLLELAMKPEQDMVITQNIEYVGVDELDTRRIFNPPQWPNESYTDYLKRIGEYNEASSDNENFEDSFK